MFSIKSVCVAVFLFAIASESMPQSAFTKAQHGSIESEADGPVLGPRRNGPDVTVAGPVASPGPPGIIDEEEFTETTTPFVIERTSSIPSRGTTAVTEESETTKESDSWTDTLKCEACKIIAGWLVSKATSSAGLEEWLDGKCDSTWLLADVCKELVMSKIQKITAYDGTNAQLCQMTLEVC